jgi:hypothetical protein
MGLRVTLVSHPGNFSAELPQSRRGDDRCNGGLELEVVSHDFIDVGLDTSHEAICESMPPRLEPLDQVAPERLRDRAQHVCRDDGPLRVGDHHDAVGLRSVDGFENRGGRSPGNVATPPYSSGCQKKSVGRQSRRLTTGGNTVLAQFGAVVGNAGNMTSEMNRSVVKGCHGLRMLYSENFR